MSSIDLGGHSIKYLLDNIDLNPFEFVDGSKLLLAIYAKLKENDGSYSYQKMAIDLGMKSASNLHKLVKADRPIGKKTGYKIADLLSQKALNRRYFKLLVDLGNAKSLDDQEKILAEVLSYKRKHGPTKFSEAQEELHSEWYHFIIWELLSIPRIDQSPMSLAKRLKPNIRPAQVAKSIELLLKLEMIKYNPVTMRLEANTEQFHTGAEAESLLTLKYHQQVLDITKNSVTSVRQAERDLSATSFRVSKERLKYLKKQIYEFQLQLLAQEAEPKDTDAVYHFNVQLFPVTEDLSEVGGAQCEKGDN